MAINLCSESSPGFIMSPRISFSHNLCQNDIVQIESHRSDSSLIESNCDFNFCFGSERSKQESSTADELFFDGKILPLQMKEKLLPSNQIHQSDLPLSSSSSSSLVTNNSVIENSKPEKSSSKSFWRFNRSSSCGNGYKRSLICSLPLLLRSNSTGSAPISKSKENQKQQQKPSISKSYQKPPLKKNYGSYNSSTNNGINYNPVLNVPNLLGLGSLFSNGKDKNNKKK